MRAVTITKPGGPQVLTVTDREVRAAGPGEVRIAVKDLKNTNGSPAKLAEARRTGIPVPAPHSPEWAPDLTPTLKGAIRAETTELLELLK